MARSQFVIPFTASFEETNQKIESILKENGFFLKDYHGETVWKKGTGAMTAMQYIKLEYGQGSVTLYGWVQAGLGDVGGKEMDLKGFFGAMPKQSLLKVIKKIQAAVS